MADKRDAKNERSGGRLAEQIQFNVVFVATFIVFAAAAFVALLLPWTWLRRFGSQNTRWFIGRAWDDAGTFTELAFMG